MIKPYVRPKTCPACRSIDTKPFFGDRWHCNKCNERWTPKEK